MKTKTMTLSRKFSLLFIKNAVIVFAIISLSSCEEKTITSGDLIIKFDNNMFSQISSSAEGAKNLTDEFSASEFLVLRNGLQISDFKLSDYTTKNNKDGMVYLLRGRNTSDNIEKIVEVKTYNQFPGLAVFKVSYINSGKNKFSVEKWVNNNHAVIAEKDSIAFWSFQGQSTSQRADWILPVKPGFFQKNYMGMNNTDFGGGIPVSDLWRRDIGIAVGMSEPVAKYISIPVEFEYGEKTARSWVEYVYPGSLEFNPGDTIKTFETFVSVHKGDCFNTLRQYSQYMQTKGIVFPPSEDAAFESVWCAWGYERRFTLNEIIGTLPKVKELGIKWAVLDDGFQQAEGDWHTNTERFPNGDRDMINLVNRIHGMGLKAMIWWAPMCADPGSNLLKEHPEYALRTADWGPQFITWWDAYYLSPTHPGVLKYTKDVVSMFIKDWGFDGLKLDGQFMNAVPPDYNDGLSTENPDQAFEKLPDFFKTIYTTAREIKPNAVILHCPCGACMNFYNMPTANQVVASDPESSWQIRLKGKIYRAIMPNTAYFGDHIELSDSANDFASQFGIGSVLGTKFTWPKDNPYTREGKFLLTPEREKIWKKWFKLYDQKMLSKAVYRGELYDIGFDKPETHAIQKADTLFYAFYSTNWDGKIELRGLKDENYLVRDYVNDKILGNVSKSSPYIQTKFSNNLLVEVYPSGKSIIK
jgi:alpha-galactosidase